MSAFADLCALAAAPQPDARLIAACERFLELKEERAKLYKNEPRGYMKRVRATNKEVDDLEAEIAQTPAATSSGRHAKAEVAMHMLGMTGTIAQTARSVIRDFLNA